MAGSVKYDKRSLVALKSRLTKLDTVEVAVGFFEEDSYGSENDNQPVANIAWINERGFGREIPSRPFMSKTFLSPENTATYVSLIEEVVRQVVTLGRGQNRVMKALGEKVAATMRKVIRNGVPPPNSDEWAEYKGFNHPLIHTGRMLSSIKAKIRGS